MTLRFTEEHVAAWRRDGACLIESFFTPKEVAAVVADFDGLFEGAEGGSEALDLKRPDEVGRFRPDQFAGTRPVPIDCSPALNLIGVHPEIVRFARAALGCADVHVYQCQAMAKFTGAADYDQPFHCDFPNHTLTTPDDPARPSAITILCYFTEVTDAHGAARYVTRPDAASVARPEETLSRDPAVQARLQSGLAPLARSTAGPAGSIFPYTIDVFHRGANLTARGARRYSVMTCFKRAGDETIAFTAWAFHHTRPWARIFDHASPEQLACFGVRPPGHPFWTQATLGRAQARYPGWDLAPWREALGLSVAAA